MRAPNRHPTLRPLSWALAFALAGAGLGPVAQAQATSPAASARPPGAKAAPARKAARPAKPAKAAQPKRPATDVAAGPSYAGRPEAAALARDIAERHGLDPAWVQAQLAGARLVPAVARLIMPPPAGSAKNWQAYRARFVEPARVQAGVAFWDAQARWLDAAAERFGVPAELVIGIIGVETYYGRLTGGFRVLDALATLSLDFPSGRKDRSAFFRDELGEFLKLAHSQGLEPSSVKGSFAGAMGLGQFMPGSINRHALDFDGDGRIDMVSSAADVIGSIGHYMVRHGWQRGMPTHFAVRPPVDTTERARLLAPDILPSFSAAQLAEHGAELDADGRAHGGPLALVELQNGDAAPSHIAGTTNFYAVTRYNWSAYYALAVIELGRAVATQRQAAR
ncbi:lytic murein transglycosylase B [Aquabacterium sp. OR-4]|uniref:lytic murein transglycosylase B n=1 Tax=Aquabacterium sp. OR-4 TaxID=2978127 RepID=UPI0021B1CA44|nr:lytic murein transglycosylase B [Aquabacterium sp. OR-4]MDT7836827.1 lytic murein transglycosylase B [Aquabacterium sp. OR-4]